MIRSGLPRWGLASAVLFACASGTSAASASPLFELSGGSTGGGGFNARVTGASSASTYFNPALLPYAEQAFETGVLVLTDQISLTLDGRPSGDVPAEVGNRSLVDPDGNPISNATMPTGWLEKGCPPTQCSAPAFGARPRQGAGSSKNLRAYQIVGLVTPIVPKRLVLGIHAMVPLGKFTTAGSFYNDEREQFFSNSLHPELYSDRLTATSIAFGVGSEIVQNLSVGVSFTLNLVNEANAGTYVRDPNDYDKLLLDTNVGVRAKVAPHFGATWAPLEALRVAATVHTEQKFVIDTSLTAALPSGNESGTSRTQVHDFVPWIFGLGGTLDVVRNAPHQLAIAATGTYSLWSRYLDRHGQSPGDYGPDFAWKDTLGGSIGLRHAHGALRDFVDFTWQPSPVPEQVGRSNYVDSTRLGLMVGADYTFELFGLRWRPGLSLQGHRIVERYHKKSDALIRDEVPDDAVDVQTKQPIAGSQGLQTNNPGWPGFASGGWVYGGAFTVSLLY